MPKVLFFLKDDNWWWNLPLWHTTAPERFTSPPLKVQRWRKGSVLEHSDCLNKMRNGQDSKNWWSKLFLDIKCWDSKTAEDELPCSVLLNDSCSHRGIKIEKERWETQWSERKTKVVFSWVKDSTDYETALGCLLWLKRMSSRRYFPVSYVQLKSERGRCAASNKLFIHVDVCFLPLERNDNVKKRF